MATMYLLVRKLEHPGGAVSRFTIKAFSEPTLAGNAAKQANGKLAAIVRGRIGVQRGGEVEDAGITVANVLGDLGILGVIHDVETVEVHESDLVTAAPRIILPA